MAQEAKQRKKLIDILAQVSQETGVDVTDIIGPKRRALYVKARSFFARIARDEGYAFVDIGEALGGRAHTTVMEYFHDEENEDTGGPENMNKAEAKERIKKFNKEDRKNLTAAIAETADKGERDELAAFFSGSEEVAEPASVEAREAGREADRQVPEVKEQKKKSFLDDL